jgi:mRNA interferase RelE/StbE
MYELRLDEDAEKVYRKANINLALRLNRCFDRLCQNPYKHPNTKRLKGVLTGLYRCRVGDWRIISEVFETEQVVNILQIIHRSKAYR